MATSVNYFWQDAALVIFERPGIRISREQYLTLKRAARIRRCTTRVFIADAVNDAADRVLKGETICLSLDDRKAFADALLSPKKPNTASRRAFEIYRKRVRRKQPKTHSQRKELPEWRP